jgi:ankyrin repeat protein
MLYGLFLRLLPMGKKSKKKLTEDQVEKLTIDALVATERGDLPALKKLMKKHSELILEKRFSNQDGSRTGETIAHVAASYGHVNIIQWLAKKYPDLLMITDEKKNTIAHVAASYGRVNIIDYLAKNDQTQCLLSAQDENGNTIAHIAAGFHRSQSPFIRALALSQVSVEMIKLFEELNPALITTKNEKGQTILHTAVQYGRNEIIEYLAEKYPDLLTITDKKGQTILHTAAQHPYNLATDLLLEKCPDLLTAKDAKDQTIAHIAAEKGDIVMIQYLLEKNKDLFINTDDTSRTPAHIAAENGQIEVLASLLEDLEHFERLDTKQVKAATKEKKQTLAHIAVKHRYAKVISALMEMDKQNPNLKLFETKDTEGKTPADYAKEYHYDDTSGLIGEHITHQAGRRVVHKSTVAVVKKRNTKALEHILKQYPARLTDIAEEHSELLTAKDKKSRTLAHLAAKHGHAEVIGALMEINEKHPDLKLFEATDQNDYTPASMAARYFKTEVLERLLEKGPNSLARLDIKLFKNKLKSTHRTLAHTAAENGHTKVLEYLLKKDPRLLEAKDNEGRTPAHIAVLHGKINVLTALHEIKPELLEAKDKEGQTPANLAAERQRVDIVDLLMSFSSGDEQAPPPPKAGL